MRRPVLSTQAKIRAARWIYFGVAAVRKLFGRPRVVSARRHDITFELDLAEGIDLAIYLFGSFEAQTRRVLARLVGPGDIVLDIGANVGAHTLPLAKAVGPAGRVIAFEPTDLAFRRLRRNLQLNPELASRVTAAQVYLDDGIGDVVRFFYASWRLDSRSDQHPKHFGSFAAAANAARSTLDDYLKESRITRVDAIKVDVDGFESRVLRGAHETLARHRPAIVLELCPYALEERGSSLAELLHLLTAAEYRLYDERGFHPMPSDARRLSALIAPDSSINVVALGVDRTPAHVKLM